MNDYDTNVKEWFKTHLKDIKMSCLNFCLIVEVIPKLKEIRLVHLMNEYRLSDLCKNPVFMEYYQTICENSLKDCFIAGEKEIFYEMYVYSNGVLKSVDELDLFFESHYDLDPDGNLVPKFKGYFEILKEISFESSLKGGKWVEWNLRHK